MVTTEINQGSRTPIIIMERGIYYRITVLGGCRELWEVKSLRVCLRIRENTFHQPESPEKEGKLVLSGGYGQSSMSLLGWEWEEKSSMASISLYLVVGLTSLLIIRDDNMQTFWIWNSVGWTKPKYKIIFPYLSLLMLWLSDINVFCFTSIF